MSLTEPRTTDAVRTFAALSHDDVLFAGGKGANLGELTAAGLPVPGGFVVGAPAYAAFCDADGLRARIEDGLAEVDVDDTAAHVRRTVSATDGLDQRERLSRVDRLKLVCGTDHAPEKSVSSGSRSPRRTARSTSMQRMPRDSASVRACGLID